MVKNALRVGRGGRVFTRWSLESPRWLAWLPALYHLVRGDLALVGPRPLSPEESEALGPRASVRHSVQPGLVSPWRVRQRANVAFEPEIDADLAWLEQRGVRATLGVLFRAAACAWLPVATPHAPRALTVLDVRIDNLSMREAVSAVTETPVAGPPRHVAFVNADCFNRAAVDDQYAAALRGADLVLPDGIGVRLAGWFLQQPVRENVNGTDLFPRLCGAIARTPHSVYLLGGQPGVADGVANWMAAYHPEVRIAGTAHGFFAPADEAALVQRIRQSGASLLLVAFGAPRQDVWIAKHLAATGVAVAIGVGGLFDFYSGRIRRAAPWMRELGLEWVWRLMQEPRRLWRRYLVGNAVFLLRVFRSRHRAAAGRPISNEGSI